MTKAIFTICAENFISSALVLSETIKEQSSEKIDFHIIIADKLNSNYETQDGIFLQTFDALCQVDLFHQKIRYNITEYCTFLKPLVFTKLFENYEEILYIDPDIVFFDDPVLLFNEFSISSKEILITPHFLKSSLLDKPYSETNHLFEGIYNFGFIGVKKSSRTIEFLSWWTERLYYFCYGDRATNLHTDQKWGDYLPALFEDVTKVLVHPGYNVAHWNLHERHLSLNDKKFVVNNEWPLVFFHFSGFDYFGSGLVRRGGVIFANNDDFISSLANIYRSKLVEKNFSNQIKCIYDWNFDADGNLISHFQRRILRNLKFHKFNEIEDYYNFWKLNNLIDCKVQTYIGYSSSTENHLEKKMRLIFKFLKIIRYCLGISRYSRMIKLMEFLSKIENHSKTMK